MKKTYALQVRISADEIATLKKIATENRVSLSAFVRSKIFDRTAPKRTKTEPEVVRALAGIGNNLNQIARAVNTAAVSGGAVNGLELLSVLRAIERKLNDY